MTADKNNRKVPMLQAVDLTKQYEDGITAVDSLSFTVHTGEIFAMLGGNGAGKTTTINLFLNLIEPTSGKALINNIPSNTNPLEAKQFASFVSENVMLYPDFTPIQNLDYFSKLGGKHDYTTSDYEQVLRRVGLQESAFGKRLKSFSKGMRQKCGIAIAILKDSPAVLLDEPTSGLDPKAGLEFLTLLDDLRSEGKAILMSTHDIFRAKEIADTIGIMREGKLVMLESKENFINEDLEQLYITYITGLNEPAA